jgi:hypothetical protein
MAVIWNEPVRNLMVSDAAGLEQAPLFGVVTLKHVRPDVFDDLQAHQEIDRAVRQRNMLAVISKKAGLRYAELVLQKAIPPRHVRAYVHPVDLRVAEREEIKKLHGAAAAMVQDGYVAPCAIPLDAP